MLHFFNLSPLVSDPVISFVSLTANANIADVGSSVVLTCSVQLSVPATELDGANISYDYGFTMHEQKIRSQLQMDSVQVTNITSAVMHTCTVTLIANSTCSARKSCPKMSDTEVIALQCKPSCFTTTSLLVIILQ